MNTIKTSPPLREGQGQREVHVAFQAKTMSFTRKEQVHRIQLKNTRITGNCPLNQDTQTLPETSSVPSVNISRVKEEICPVKLDRLDRPPVKLLLSQEDILKVK